MHDIFSTTFLRLFTLLIYIITLHISVILFAYVSCHSLTLLPSDISVIHLICLLLFLLFISLIYISLHKLYSYFSYIIVSYIVVCLFNPLYLGIVLFSIYFDINYMLIINTIISISMSISINISIGMFNPLVSILLLLVFLR